MPSDLDIVAARDLQPGNLIRLTDSRFDHVRSVSFEGDHLIVGGSHNVTARALRVVTEGGASFLVHPGRTFGVKIS
jgi:hypothetical protein